MRCSRCRRIMWFWQATAHVFGQRMHLPCGWFEVIDRTKRRIEENSHA